MTLIVSSCISLIFHLSRYHLLNQVSWTHALRQIVINCYRYHGREDLLPAFSEDDDKSSNKDGQTPKEKVKSRPTHTTISVAPVTGTLQGTNMTTVTSIGDPNALAQTVNV